MSVCSNCGSDEHWLPRPGMICNNCADKWEGERRGKLEAMVQHLLTKVKVQKEFKHSDNYKESLATANLWVQELWFEIENLEQYLS